MSTRPTLALEFSFIHQGMTDLDVKHGSQQDHREGASAALGHLNTRGALRSKVRWPEETEREI